MKPGREMELAPYMLSPKISTVNARISPFGAYLFVFLDEGLLGEGPINSS